MRKMLKKTVVTAVLASTVIGLTGCGTSGVFSGTLSGKTGSSTKITYDGNLLDADVLDKTAKIESIIDNYYYNDIDDDTIREGIYKGIMESLDDPYAQYYTPRKSMPSCRRMIRVSMPESELRSARMRIRDMSVR